MGNILGCFDFQFEVHVWAVILDNKRIIINDHIAYSGMSMIHSIIWFWYILFDHGSSRQMSGLTNTNIKVHPTNDALGSQLVVYVWQS